MEDGEHPGPEEAERSHMSPGAQRALDRIREAALRYPEAHEEFPWGDQVIKVRAKIFVFLGAGTDGGFGMSVKLPHSHPMALSQPFATPTGYGLGRAGWVTAQFGPNDEPPLDLLEEWLDESYRAVAPKRLVSEL
jgi:predicted DNA-binding protein (MmcQ/YjbR family)